MHFCNFNRRFFLRGLGGAALALPLLPSLIRTGHAASTPKKRFIAVTQDHGFFEDEWFPANYKDGKDYSKAFNEVALSSYAGRLSGILGDEFSGLKDKVTLFRGLDSLKFAPQDGSHDVGFTLAGTAARDPDTSPQGKSIDVLLSESDHVYPAGSTPAFRHLSVSMSYAGHSLTVKNGRMETMPAHQNPKALFDLLFGGGVPDAETPEQKAERLRDRSVVQAVYGDYQRLQSSARISMADKRVLGEHMELVHSLEQRFADDASTSGCSSLNGDGYHNYSGMDAKDYDQRYGELFDVIFLALKCGLTNVAHIGLPTSETSNTTDVEDAIYRHLDEADLKFTQTIHSYSHSWEGNRREMLKAQKWLASLAGKFINKLTAVENSETGATYLDNSLVMYVNNLSQGSTHLRYDIPVVLAGSVGGRFRTGNFVDYTTAQSHTTENSSGKYVGVDYTRMLATILQGFGLSEAEYQQPGMPEGGFGSDHRSGRTHESLTTAKRREVLPGVLV